MQTSVSQAGLGAAYAAYARYERTRDFACLDTAIHNFQHSLDAAPEPNVELLGWLGYCLWKRFELRGKLDDLERTISVLQGTLQLMPSDDPERAKRLGDMAISMQQRFRHLGKLDDLEDAIRMQQRAVELTPDGHPDMAIRLVNLTSSQSLRYEHLGDVCDLERAIAGQQRAVELTPNEHTDMPLRLTSLALSLRTCFMRLGKLVDLERALAMQYRAVELVPDGHPDTAAWLDNLACLQHLRFEHLGDYTDLERAIAGQQRVVQLVSEGHPDMPTRLNNLGNSLRTRFQHLGELDDLESATRLQRRVLELIPDDHPSTAGSLANLAFVQELRYERLGNVDDLECAIAGRRRAVELVPEGHSDMPLHLNNLGASLYTRFKRLDEVDDINGAISAQRHGVELTPVGHPALPTWLNNLGALLGSRFERLGDLDDLKHAVASERRAIELSSHAHPTKPVSLSNLAHLLALHLPTPDALLRAHSRILDMLPEIVWLGHSLKRRLKESRRLRGLANSAVHVAIHAGALAQAVEWSDAGRSLIWSQVLSLRSPVNDLVQYYPDLAHSLEKVHAQLQGSVHISSISESLSATGSPALTTNAEADHHRALAIEYDKIVAEVRRQSGFGDFMRPKKLAALLPSSKSLHGYVVSVNADRASCDALIFGPKETISSVALPKLSLKKAETLRSRWQSYLGTYNVRERVMAARNYYPNCQPVVRILGCIWRWIVDPILKAISLNEPLDGNHLPHVSWCPAGPLSQLPLHAAGIYDEESGQHAYDFVVSSYTPSLSALTRCVDALAKQEHTIPSVLVATQSNTPGLEPLPGTVVEGARLHELFSRSHIAHTVLNGEQATSSAVRAAIDSHTWLHLACHGQQDLSDPTKSAFALSDEPLSLTDLMTLKDDNAELAFLSACQTAVGDEKIPEESMHLAAGMLAVGFKGVVATMWSIRDDDAPLVVETYYKKLLELRASGTLEKGETGAAYALHEATKRLREEVGEKEFVRWAPFVHFGV
ncbi:hypothetical protein PENSPDRAFT_636072 [Peniophora sp. CONT]|nr:hypothetical protein PENSPDRAFT_636072 [Peniophora sp. CONT]